MVMSWDGGNSHHVTATTIHARTMNTTTITKQGIVLWCRIWSSWAVWSWMATLKLTLKTRENAKELDRIGIETVIDVKAAMKLRPLDDPGIMFQNSKSLLLVRFTDKIIEARSGRNIILSAYYPRKLAGIFVPTQRARIIDDFKEDANHIPYDRNNQFWPKFDMDILQCTICQIWVTAAPTPTNTKESFV